MSKSPYSNIDTLRVDTLIRPKTPWWRWTTDSIYGRYDFEMYAYAVEAYETADQAYQTVLDTVGCWPRDHVELRLIEDTKQGKNTYAGSKSKKKGIIDLPSDAEGFYAYPEVNALMDTDQDGMPDEWEMANGCNPELADQNTRHTSGYTMLEMYLDYAMKHRPVMEDGFVESTEGIDEIQGNEVQSTKVIIDGQLLIQRAGKFYTVQGIELK